MIQPKTSLGLAFDGVAPTYDHRYTDARCRAEDAVLTNWLRRDWVRCAHETVLDVGCGTGWVPDHLDPRAGYMGFDLSEKMVEQARAKHKDLDFEVGDMAAMWPAYDGADLIVSTWAAANYVSPKTFFQRADEVAKPHARIFVVVHNEDSPKSRECVYLPKDCFGEDYRPWGCDEAVAAARANGFSVEAVAWESWTPLAPDALSPLHRLHLEAERFTRRWWPTVPGEWLVIRGEAD